MFCSNIIISGKTIFLLILNEFYGRIIVPDIIGGFRSVLLSTKITSNETDGLPTEYKDASISFTYER